MPFGPLAHMERGDLMSRSVATAQLSDPVRSLENIGPSSDRIGPGPIKADLRSGASWNATHKDAAIRYFGGVKQTAFALGQVDPSLMMREFDAGKFARFDEHADEQAKSFVAAALAEAYGPLSNPKQRGFQLLREIDQRVAEIRQLIEMVA